MVIEPALYRRLFLDKLAAAHSTGKLRFSGDLAALADTQAFAAALAPLRREAFTIGNGGDRSGS